MATAYRYLPFRSVIRTPGWGYCSIFTSKSMTTLSQIDYRFPPFSGELQEVFRRLVEVVFAQPCLSLIIQRWKGLLREPAQFS